MIRRRRIQNRVKSRRLNSSNTRRRIARGQKKRQLVARRIKQISMSLIGSYEQSA
jgi:hypothetical protein